MDIRILFVRFAMYIAMQTVVNSWTTICSTIMNAEDYWWQDKSTMEDDDDDDDDEFSIANDDDDEQQEVVDLQAAQHNNDMMQTDDVEKGDHCSQDESETFLTAEY